MTYAGTCLQGLSGAEAFEIGLPILEEDLLSMSECDFMRTLTVNIF